MARLFRRERKSACILARAAQDLAARTARAKVHRPFRSSPARACVHVSSGANARTANVQIMLNVVHGG
eukprot:2528178-Alexandrium_andersonii.AAC.1